MALHYIGMTAASDYRALFPILENGLYFNHAAVGPWPSSASEAVCDFARENCRDGPARYSDWIRREQALREQLANLVGAGDPDDIALLKNTTEGISTVAWGFPWRPGDRVVLPAAEFPSNHLPWKAQAPHGVHVDTVDIRLAKDAEQALIDALGPDTRMLSVSAVQWTDGFRLDLERLGEACGRRDVFFFVDAIQQLGALPLDVQACRIDALAADAHKWLLGPEGIAVFYCGEALRGQLQLTQQGWHMFDNPWRFHDPERSPSASARRFEAGSPNTLGQVALHATLDAMQTIGHDEIARRVLRNTGQLLDELAGRNAWDVTSRKDPGRRSGIVAIRPREGSLTAVQRELQDGGVSCALREGAIRLSPHFYQGEAEIGRLLDLLDRIRG